MGCYTWTWKNNYDRKHHNYFYLDYFLFRIFDYSKIFLTSYEEAERFVKTYYEKSTNKKPKRESKKENVCFTYTSQMNGKILFANEKQDDFTENLTDITYTLRNLKRFFEEYPKGIIDFG